MPAGGAVVADNTQSTIPGQIRTDGSVFLVNPNGIQITRDGPVQPGCGLVASTPDITPEAFMSGRGQLPGSGGTLVNQGKTRWPKAVCRVGVRDGLSSGNKSQICAGLAALGPE